MQSLPQDIRLQELWKHLSYNDIVNLSQSNNEFTQIYSNHNMWAHLMLKDFGLVYDDIDVKEVYLKLRKMLHYFSQYYPIITFEAFKALMLIDMHDWEAVTKAAVQRRINGITTELLDTYELKNLISAAIYFDYIDYDEEEWHIKINNMIDYYSEEKKFITNDILMNDCDHLLKYIKKPTIIFIKGELYVFDYDMELYIMISYFNMDIYYKCSKIYIHVKNELLALL